MCWRTCERCTMLVLALVLVCIQYTTSATSDEILPWGVTMQDCRAKTDYTHWECHWRPPPPVQSPDQCDLYFRLSVGHPHSSVPICTEMDAWTKCRQPLEGNVCQFPPDILATCGNDLDLRVQCNNNLVSEAVTINAQDITAPGPVANLVAKPDLDSSRAIWITWERPPTWKGYKDCLLYVVESWNEFNESKRTDILDLEGPIEYCIDDFKYCRHVVKVDYDYAITYVRVANYYCYNPLKTLSEWSDVVSARSEAAAPVLIGGPAEMTITDVSIDWKNMVRIVNVSWDPLPRRYHGGPNLTYIVRAKKTGDGTIKNSCTVTENHCSLELNPAFHYHFDLTARNDVDEEKLGDGSLDGLEQEKVIGDHVYYMVTAIAVVIIGLLIVSCVLIVRKKARASHLPAIPLPDKMVTVDFRDPKMEGEVFDVLKTRDPPHVINTIGSVNHMEWGDRRASQKAARTNRQTPLKLQLTDETMPLAIDVYPCDDGEVSPTDSGHCDYQLESGDDASPIPMSFSPLSGPAGRTGVFEICGERQALIGGVGYVGDAGIGGPLASRGLPSSRGPTEGRVVGGAAPTVPSLGSQPQGEGRNDTGENYTPQSEGSSLGYVQQSMASQDTSSIPSVPSYITELQGRPGNGVTTGSSISSYVQHGEATPPPVPNIGVPIQTSGGSDCPPYVKQSSQID